MKANSTCRYNVPLNQVNAHLAGEPVMRIGIPHRGGRLAYHAFEQEYPAMISASAFWNSSSRQFQVPEMSDIYELDFALDSAGYTAMKNWQAKGSQRGIANVFPWTFSQYIELASLLPCAWWSQPDLCCEPEIARNQQEIDYRVNATATLLEGTLQYVWAWQQELATSFPPVSVANLVRPPVPVVQGWSISDYLRSLDLMLSVWERWQPWLANPVLIGLGSVCRRDLSHPQHGLLAILDALDGVLPKGMKVHLFGVKGASLERIREIPWVASADSMAYDYSARMKACKSGKSNSIAHRSDEMTRWMNKALATLRAPSGVNGKGFKIPNSFKHFSLGNVNGGVCHF